MDYDLLFRFLFNIVCTSTLWGIFEFFVAKRVKSQEKRDFYYKADVIWMDVNEFPYPYDYIRKVRFRGNAFLATNGDEVSYYMPEYNKDGKLCVDNKPITHWAVVLPPNGELPLKQKMQENFYKLAIPNVS